MKPDPERRMRALRRRLLEIEFDELALLDRHASRLRPASAGDWLFVAGILAAVVAVALVPLIVVYWLLTCSGTRSNPLCPLFPWCPPCR
jgi:hypothetical protein